MTMPASVSPGPSIAPSAGRALPFWLLALAAVLVAGLLIAQFSGLFRGPAIVAPPTAPVAPVSQPAPQIAADEQTLQQALQAAIADNRILSPLDDNAIATLIELQGLRPEDPRLLTTLLEIYPLAVQVVEGSLDRGELDLANAQIGLLARTGHASSSLDLVREKLDRALRARDLAATPAGVAAAPSASSIGDRGNASEDSADSTAPATRVSAAPSAQTPPPDTTASAVSASQPVPTRAQPAPTQPQPATGSTSRATPSPPGSSASATADATPAAAAPVSESPPVQIAFASPVYPARARSRRIEGEVELAFTIDRSGAPIDIRVVRAEPPNIFDNEAIRAAQRWRFEPRRIDGQPVETPMTRTLRFELGG